MKRPIRILLALAIPPSLIDSAHAVVVHVSDPSALTWYKGRTADTITPGTGSVLFTEGQVSGSTYLTNLPTIDVAEGATLVLSLDFTLGTLVTTTNSLRFGLYHSGTTKKEANFNSATDNAFADDYGYLINQNFNGSSPNLFTRSGTASTALLGSTIASTGYTTVSTTNTGTLATFASTTSYSLTLTLVKLSNGFNVTSAWNGGDNVNVTRSGSDTSGNTAALTSFNQFAFYVNGGTGAVDTVNITGMSITVTPVPEPAATLLGAIGMLGLLGRRRS